MRLKLFSLIGALLLLCLLVHLRERLFSKHLKVKFVSPCLKLLPLIMLPIKELANSGFYNGIVFHRVIPGFMAQTGDPTGTGMGGSGQNLKAEFNNYQYQYGTVGMARAMSPDSADSQFFICFDGCTHLTGQYTAGVRSKAAWKPLKRSMLVSRQQSLIRSFQHALRISI